MRRWSALALAAALVGLGAHEYIAALMLSVQGTTPAYARLLWSAALGAMGIQLAAAPAGAAASARWQTIGPRGWAAALVLASIIAAARARPWYLGVFLVPVVATALLMGVWWPSQLTRRTRPQGRYGYAIGGALWLLLLIVAEVGRSYLIWTRGAGAPYLPPLTTRLASLSLAILTPAYFAVPVRVFLAGVPEPAGRPGTWWRICLAFMALMGSWGYVTALRVLTVQPSALVSGRPAALVAAGLVWGLMMLWVGRLWALRARAAT
jgi:hypothetical protein